MLWTLSVLLLFLWVVGLVSGLTVGPWIHVLLLASIATMIASALHRQVRDRAGSTNHHRGGAR